MGVLTSLLSDDAQPLSARTKILEQALTAGADRLLGHQQSRFHNDPLAFLHECVVTRDEADPRSPIKPWPTGGCAGCRLYTTHGQEKCPRCCQPVEPLRCFEEPVTIWHRLGSQGSPSIMVVPKPRRFKMSWLFSALHLWQALERRESAVYFQSRTELESALLVARCEFILENIPRSKMTPPGWEVLKKPPRIELANGSAIIGKAEGRDALRSVTATAILLDEVSFWQDARGSFEAIRPLVEKGCRLTVVSSAAPGFFRALAEGVF